MHERNRSLTTAIAHHYLTHSGASFRDLHGFQRWMTEQFHILPFKTEFVDYDPYPDHEPMNIDLDSTGVLKITTRNNEAVLDPKVNLMFRAVHDFDHCRFGYRFSIEGESQAGRALMSRCGDELGRQLIFSEIVAQAAVDHEDGSFAEQKFVPFPQGIIDALLFGL